MVPAIIAASVALVVAILTPTLTAWRARRQAVADLFDDATSALLIAQSARHYPRSISFDTEGWTPQQVAEFNVKMQQVWLERFHRTQMDARAALARLETYVPDITALAGELWEITDEHAVRVRHVVEARRRKAIKSERLFGLRRLPRDSRTRLTFIRR